MSDWSFMGSGLHDGRVAIVTGAGSGIGRSVTERFVSEGGSVVAIDKDTDFIDWTESDDRIFPVVGDVTDGELNNRAVEQAKEVFGGLHAAVFNAGVPARGDILEGDMEIFDRTIAVNVRAVVLGIRATVPELLRTGNDGSIAVTASTSGLRGDPDMWAYNTSKAAVINLVRATAVDLGPRGIRVNAVCPGPTETGMTERAMNDIESYEALRRRMPLQRWGTSDEIASVISFLISTQASIVTGAILTADGGMSANAGQFLPKEKP